MYIEVKFRCEVCGIKGHGTAALSPGTSDSTLEGIRLPKGWHIEVKSSTYVTHCSQKCLYHADKQRRVARLPRAGTN